MADTIKLTALHDRLSSAQRTLIMQAADVDALPASGTLRQIAAMEHTLVAVDAAIEEAEAGQSADDEE